MFTGIIDHCGTIKALTQNPRSLTLEISCDFIDLEEGESIAVDGICLTATTPKSKIFSCDVSPETLQLTTANQFKINRKVNLERALKIGGRLGGHWVTGHIDQTGKLEKTLSHKDYIEFSITDIAPEAASFLVKKGSIAVNGVSLTINDLDTNAIQLMLIPHTLQRTNLADLKPGDPVNLEFDYLAKLVAKQVKELKK